MLELFTHCRNAHQTAMPFRRLKRRHIADALYYAGVAFMIIGTIDLLYPSNQTDQYTTSQSPLQESSAPQFHPNGGPRSLQSITEKIECKRTLSSSNLVADSKGMDDSFLFFKETKLSTHFLRSLTRQFCIGYTCSRKALLPSQCCDTRHKNTLRYTCATCDTSLCCERLEYCVSCCLSPTHKQIRALVPKRTSLKPYALDSPFSVCVAACRSGSRSVIHENAYRAERHHCFGEQPPQFDAKLHDGLFDFAAPLGKRKPISSY